MLNILGQSRAVAQLERALRAGRLAHTWIFAGPPGVGKFTTALALARTVLCDQPVKTANQEQVPLLPADFPLQLPCGACASCRAIAAGAHPDLHVVTKELVRYHDKSGKSKATTLSIQVIRGEITGSNDPEDPAEAKIYRRSFRGRGKFFLIDEADLMEAAAQNALLKTLEEPPPDSYLILITSSPLELLSTIRSRSQLVEFGELPDALIVQGLTGQGVPSADANLLARLARGSLGLALRWAREAKVIDEKNSAAAARKKGDDEEAAPRFTPGGIVAWTRALGERLDDFVAGRGAASEVAATLAGFASEYVDLELVRDPLTSEAEAKRRGIALLIGIAAEWFADRMRHGLGAANPTPLPGQTGALDYGVVPQLIAVARAAERQLDQNVNDKIVLAAATTEWERLLR